MSVSQGCLGLLAYNTCSSLFPISGTQSTASPTPPARNQRKRKIGAAIVAQLKSCPEHAATLPPNQARSRNTRSFQLPHVVPHCRSPNTSRPSSQFAAVWVVGCDFG